MTDNPYAAMRLSLLSLMQRVDELEQSREDVLSDRKEHA